MTASYNHPVQILGTQYLVIIDGRSHVVGKDKRCHTCGDAGDTCPAVYAVARYIREGGARAPDVLPTPPRKSAPPLSACPICGAAVERDAVLDNARHGLGWRCTKDGYEHLYLHRYSHLKTWFCGEGKERHAMFIPDEPDTPVAVQLCLPVEEGSNIVPFVKSHQHILRQAA